MENQQRINPRFFFSTLPGAIGDRASPGAHLIRRQPSRREARPRPLFRPVSFCPPPSAQPRPLRSPLRGPNLRVTGSPRKGGGGADSGLGFSSAAGCGWAPLAASCLLRGVNGVAWQLSVLGPEVLAANRVAGPFRRENSKLISC